MDVLAHEFDDIYTESSKGTQQACIAIWICFFKLFFNSWSLRRVCIGAEIYDTSGLYRGKEESGAHPAEGERRMEKNQPCFWGRIAFGVLTPLSLYEGQNSK